MQRHFSKSALILLFAFFGLGFAQVNVVATIHPWYDLARQIGGDHLNASRLLPIGVSPHNFDPSPRDVVRVADADLVISNGGVGLDDWVQRLIRASGTDAQELVVMESIDFPPLGPGGADLAAAGEGTFVNTHIWLDVTIAMSAAEAIRDTLIEIDPDNADAYATNTEALLNEMQELDEELLTVLAPIEGAPFVPFHDAWPYFARRYGLNLVIEIEPFPGREPTPEYIVHALSLIEGSGARAIFSERQLSTRPAEVIAAEAGLPLYVLDPEGGGKADVESYQALMRYNAEILLEALTP